MKKRHEQKLIIWGILLLMGFNIPILLVFDGYTSVLGFPLSYFFVLSLCLLSVIVTYSIIKRYYE